MRRTSVAEQFRPTAEINVTPMIDVMLVLLIMFMLLVPAMAAELLPQARTAAPERDDRVTLGIDRHGRFYLEDRTRAEPLPPAQLYSGLAAAYARRPGDHVLYLKAHRAASYGAVLTALGAARQAGVRRVGLIAELPPARE